jgi:putative transposase
VKRQRQDVQHKTAIQLVRQYDTVSCEDVQTANLLKYHHRAKSSSEAGWSAFLSILAFTAVYAGKHAGAVPPAHTSQTCSGCGREVWKGVSVRWHRCPDEDCGASLHRDHHAALNILALGTQRRGAGQAPQASTEQVAAGVA